MRIFECRTELKWENVSHLKTPAGRLLGDQNEGTDPEPVAAKEVPLKVIKQDEENKRKSWMAPEVAVIREEIDERRTRRFNLQVILAALMGLVILIGWLLIAVWFFQK
jgi:hypothetical protein